MQPNYDGTQDYRRGPGQPPAMPTQPFPVQPSAAPYAPQPGPAQPGPAPYGAQPGPPYAQPAYAQAAQSPPGP